MMFLLVLAHSLPSTVAVLKERNLHSLCVSPWTLLLEGAEQTSLKNCCVCLLQTIWELHEIVAKYLSPVQPNWELRAENQ